MDDIINALCGKGRNALNEKFVEHALEVDKKHARKRVATLEGRVQDYRDDQATVEKKLTERLPDDELAPPELDRDASPPEKPDFDAKRDPGDEEKKDEEIGKEYLGRKDDIHFYVVSAEAEGEEKDLQIVDQEGKLIYSAKENDLESTDMLHFLIDALKTIPIEGVSVDIFHKYMIPAIEELEQKEEEERLNTDDELVPSPGKDIDKEEVDRPQRPLESKTLAETVVVWQNREFNVQLVDESTGDETVLSINGKPFRFSETFASQFREDDGSMTEDKVKELALDALSALNKEDFDRLALAGKQSAKECAADKDKGKKKVKEETVTEDAITEEARKASEVNKGIRQLKKDLKQAVKDEDYERATELSTQLDTIDRAVAGGIENATAAELKKAEEEAAAEKAEPDPADGTGEQPEPGTEPPAKADAPAVNAEVAASTTAASVAEPAVEPVGAAAEGKEASPDKDKDEVIIKKLSEND